MVTDTINVSSDGSGREEALLETEKLADYISLGSKQRLRLRLLAEETLGLVAAISKDFTARYRAESLETGKCIIHLEADADMDYGKRKEFISVSTSGKNEASKGFMGKIRSLFENGLGHGSEELSGVPAYMEMGMTGSADMQGANNIMYIWSLENYREGISGSSDTGEDAFGAGDELEKSIVASLADDVKVAVSGNKVELTIEYTP